MTAAGEAWRREREARSAGSEARMKLGDDVFDHVTEVIGEAEIATIVAVGHLGVIEAEEGHDGGVEVMDMDFIFGGAGTELVGGTVGGAAFDASARHPSDHGAAIVIAAGEFVAVAIADHRATEFAAPDDEGGVEHSALFEIAEEGGGRAIDFAGFFGEGFVEFVVVIPATGVDLDEADAAFDEAPSDEHFGAEFGGAVHLAYGGGFFIDIKGFGGLGLHFESHFEGFDAGFELGVFLEGLGVHLVELMDEIELVSLAIWAGELVMDIEEDLIEAHF